MLAGRRWADAAFTKLLAHKSTVFEFCRKTVYAVEPNSFNGRSEYRIMYTGVLSIIIKAFSVYIHCPEVPPHI